MSDYIPDSLRRLNKTQIPTYFDLDFRNNIFYLFKMSSRSKKIMDLINPKIIPPPADASDDKTDTRSELCDSPSLLQNSHPESFTKEDYSGQNVANHVVVIIIFTFF